MCPVLLATQELPPEERARLQLEEFDERVRAREEEARLEIAEERQLKKARREQAAGRSIEEAGTETFVEQASDEMTAMMGFGGFGGSSKQR